VTTAAHPADLSTRGAGRRLAGVATASAGVLAACALSALRIGFAEDAATLLRIHGARMLLGVAAGALLATTGALRQARGGEQPLRELVWFAGSAGAAAGGWWLAARWKQVARVDREVERVETAVVRDRRAGGR
jgi:hypothetical protein